MGIILFLLVLLSCAAMYLYAYFEKQNKIPSFITEQVNALSNEAPPPADSSADTSSVFELPDVPELSDIFGTSKEAHKETPEKAPEETSQAAPQDTSQEAPQAEPQAALQAEPQASEKSFNVSYNSFDEQAHYQLMKQNAKEYNYRQAHKHGLRIERYLLGNSERIAEWGHILLEAGMPQEARAVLQRLSSGDSMSSEATTDLAFAMHRSGSSEEAIQFLDSKNDAKNIDIITAKAAIAGEHSDTTKRAAAEPLFKQALKINSNAPDANYYYGRYLMQRGDFKNSKFYLERAVKARPDEPRYVARLGMAEFYLKKDLNAENLYKKSLSINPYDYNTWFNLGELYLSQANESNHVPEVRRKIRMALEAYLKTVELESKHANAHSRIGLILNGNGEYAEAIKHLNIALEKMPRDILIMQQLSSAYLYMQDTARSIDFLERILRIDPFNKIAANEFRRLNGE
jgi:tetratricopeptide (TPR) repeat protein